MPLLRSSPADQCGDLVGDRQLVGGGHSVDHSAGERDGRLRRLNEHKRVVCLRPDALAVKRGESRTPSCSTAISVRSEPIDCADRSLWVDHPCSPTMRRDDSQRQEEGSRAAQPEVAVPRRRTLSVIASSHLPASWRSHSQHRLPSTVSRYACERCPFRRVGASEQSRNGTAIPARRVLATALTRRRSARRYRRVSRPTRSQP